MQDDETVIYDFNDSELRNDETIIYDLQTDDFGRLKCRKSELVKLIELDENETTESVVEATIIFSKEKVNNESDDEPTEPSPFLKEANESFAIIRRHFEACGSNYIILYKLEK